MKRTGTRSNLPALLLALTATLGLGGCGSTPPSPVEQAPGGPPSAADLRVQQWRALLAIEQGAAEPRKLEVVNAFFNRLFFVEDIDHWGEEDFWATPLETIRSNGGDCEDFVIGKYFTLRELDVPERRLRLTYVLAEQGRRPHMVLSYYETPGSEPLLLDNLVAEILPASLRTDLRPVYGFNTEGLWVAGRDNPSLDDPAARMSRWRDLLRRMGEEDG